MVHFSLYACNISPGSGSGSGSAFDFWVGSGSRSVKKTDPKRCFLDGPVRFLDGPGRNQDNGNHREIDYLPKSEQRKEMACKGTSKKLTGPSVGGYLYVKNVN